MRPLYYYYFSVYKDYREVLTTFSNRVLAFFMVPDVATVLTLTPLPPTERMETSDRIISSLAVCGQSTIPASPLNTVRLTFDRGRFRGRETLMACIISPLRRWHPPSTVKATYLFLPTLSLTTISFHTSDLYKWMGVRRAGTPHKGGCDLARAAA